MAASKSARNASTLVQEIPAVHAAIMVSQSAGARIGRMAEEKPSFESSLDQLEQVVKELEAGDLPLDKSVELFEKGMALSETCRNQLEEAETRVETLIKKNGKIQAEPYRPE
jgi:exodeoxyribonuclease VII small subunit